jgi:hypothetical protein
MFIIYIIHKFEYSTSSLFSILLFTLHNDEFTWAELLLLGFYHIYIYIYIYIIYIYIYIYIYI